VWKSLRAMKSERYAREADVSLREDPVYPVAQDLGKVEFSSLDDDLGSTEEDFTSAIASKIPGMAGSKRAMVTLLNQYRMSMFKSMAGSLDKPTPHELKVIGKAVNVFTGRGNAGDPGSKLSRAMDFLAIPFFSPRNWLSKIQIAIGQPAYRGTRRTRLAVAKEYARAGAGVAAFYMLKGMYEQTTRKREKEEGTLSSKFGKPEIDGTVLDPYGGITQLI